MVDELHAGSLVSVLDEYAPAALAIYTVKFLRHRHQSHTVKVFTEFLRNIFGKKNFS